MSKVDIDIKALLEAGAHFGHKTSRWHPKMALYIHSKHEDNHIIDLTKTVEALDKALDFLVDVAASGNLPGALNGDIDDLIDRLHTAELELIKNE